MKQSVYGLILFLFLMLPPVVTLTESIMIVHMHVQMPLLGIAGMLMVPFLQKKCPGFFAKWNPHGIPGILLFLIIILYWLIPRTMDEALTSPVSEAFKFISWPFLAGVPLRDSWPKLTAAVKNTVYVGLSVLFGFVGWVYITSPDQLCNNYLIVEQRTLGWGFLLMALCLVIYFIQLLLMEDDDTAYE